MSELVVVGFKDTEEADRVLLRLSKLKRAHEPKPDFSVFAIETPHCNESSISRSGDNKEWGNSHLHQRGLKQTHWSMMQTGDIRE